MNLILGDSHALALQRYDSATTQIHSISGATIFGLQHATSQSGASQQILDLLKERSYDTLFIMFGKVDLE